MIRLFIALEIPEPVRRSLSMLSGGVPGARWTPQENFHLTLRFIGDVDETVAIDVDDALSQLSAPTFILELAGVGEFGGKNPRALFASVRHNEALIVLQRKIETALRRIGLPNEERKFTPHVTLARLRAAPRNKVVEFLTAHALFASVPIDVKNFALFSSHLSSNGSIYRVEKTYPLKAGE